MKKSLLILLATLALAPIANCGLSLGGIPGNFTLNSIGPGRVFPGKPKAATVTTKAGKRERTAARMAHSSKRKARPSAGRDQLSRLQPI